MSDRNYLMLFTQFSGFRIVVLANRLGCTNDLARQAHDKLIKELDQLIGITRNVMRIERELAQAIDPAAIEDWEEEHYYAEGPFVDALYGDPFPLLDYIVIDWATREWCHPGIYDWCFIADWEPVMNDVSNEALCGLRDIMQQIERETGVSFSAYLDDRSSVGVDPGIFCPEFSSLEAVDELFGEDTDGEVP